jgi:nucleotide-binding universal stress UspA family protein
MKLLVPVDGSAASINAVKKALEIARKYGADIKLITVVDPDHYLRFMRNDEIWSHVDRKRIEENSGAVARMEESSYKLLDAIVEKLDFNGIRAEREVLLGEPHIRILEDAEKEMADVIIIGNRGFSKIKRFFLGSVAQRVISEAKCPVLVIHSETEY